MGLLDRLRRTATVPDDAEAPMPGFRIEPGETTRFVVPREILALMEEGQAQRSAQEQYLVLEMLADEGRALPMPDGFEVSADDIARLDDDEARVLGLPPFFTGELSTVVEKWTSSPEFAIRVTTKVGQYPETHLRRGAELVVGKTPFRLTVPQLRALRAIERHSALRPDERTETVNVRLVAELQAARKLAAASPDPLVRATFNINLGSLEKFSTVVPSTVSLIVTPKPDGSLGVEPDIGPEVDRDLVANRWHQIDRTVADGTDGGVLRAGNSVVLLEPSTLAAVAEVRRRPQIPAELAQTFYEAPGSFYDPEIVDVDAHLGLRIAGLGVVPRVSYAKARLRLSGWTGATPPVVEPPTILETLATTRAEQAEIEVAVTDAIEKGEETADASGHLVDVADPPLVLQYIDAANKRLAELDDGTELIPPDDGVPDAGAPDHATSSPDDPAQIGSSPEDASHKVDGEGTSPTRVHSGRPELVSWHFRDPNDLSGQLRTAAAGVRPTREVDWAALNRSPFPHQRDGVEWMTGLMQAGLLGADDDPSRIQGALLADDMGLGKTFMTLAALNEVMRSQREHGPGLPHLVVMPVALLENWLSEIRGTFGSEYGPFDDVVVLHGDGLAAYRQDGRGKENEVTTQDIGADGMVRHSHILEMVSLKIGEAWGERRLDRPNTLVLTTYDVLRRYQVSFNQVRWGIVVMDEAQWTKNPEILLTRAAKGIQAKFKLLATGTPVENSLQDFWCLMDTAQSGLLGSWSHFKTNWDIPMSTASGDELVTLGRELRAVVGEFMLRRTKEDELPDLPSKFVEHYRTPMPTIQRDAYDSVLKTYHEMRRARDTGAALTTIGHLRTVSLHPGLHQGGLHGVAVEAAHSARTQTTLDPILSKIRDQGEKAIIFVERKDLQRALVLWINERFGLNVDIVNGDTAVSGSAERSRTGRISRFEAVEGFNVIIMSPKAVGVGLTVVGANHAIHLERMWNPAKEAQATDRIHRIGQTRPVVVHYPMAIHPDVDSFDVMLDRLLDSKLALKGAVVVPQRDVSPKDVERGLGLN